MKYRLIKKPIPSNRKPAEMACQSGESGNNKQLPAEQRDRGKVIPSRGDVMNVIENMVDEIPAT